MYTSITTLFRTRLGILLLLFGMVSQAHAAALLTLKGSTDSVRYANESEIRLSVLGYSEPDAVQSVVQAIRDYQLNANADVLARALQQQASKGYLFTSAATGHSIKYAWQTRVDGEQKLVLLIVPALKTLNPYMWKTPNSGEQAFSLLELRGDGEQFELRTSLDAQMAINDEGHLQLRDYDAAGVFATLHDDTPYYLKSGS